MPSADFDLRTADHLPFPMAQPLKAKIGTAPVMTRGELRDVLVASGHQNVATALDAIMSGHAWVTHGRHCPCSSCKREDWMRITAPCGMHGPDCPAVYAPIKKERLYDSERKGVSE